MRYTLVLTPDDNDTFLVTCPDLPEVTSFGDTEVEALQHGADAILTALQGRISQREAIPEPSAKEGIDAELSALIYAKLALYRAFQSAGISKAEWARRLDWHNPSIDRLLDLDHDFRIGQIGAALKVLGYNLDFEARSAA